MGKPCPQLVAQRVQITRSVPSIDVKEKAAPPQVAHPTRCRKGKR
jgi:hypothetical protein